MQINKSLLMLAMGLAIAAGSAQQEPPVLKPKTASTRNARKRERRKGRKR